LFFFPNPQGYKTGKFNRQWPLEDIVKVKRHAINHHCFSVTCLVRTAVHSHLSHHHCLVSATPVSLH
jgi:hypothetical protein